MSEIWVRTCSSPEDEQEADREFWEQMAGDKRVEAVEDMRLDEKVKGRERLGRLRRTVRVSQRS